MSRLLQELPDTVDAPGHLIEQGRVLDNYHIPSRYPNGHPEGAPLKHYGPLDSEEAIRYAREIVDLVGYQVA